MRDLVFYDPFAHCGGSAPERSTFPKRKRRASRLSKGAVLENGVGALNESRMRRTSCFKIFNCWRPNAARPNPETLPSNRSAATGVPTPSMAQPNERIRTEYVAIAGPERRR